MEGGVGGGEGASASCGGESEETFFFFRIWQPKLLDRLPFHAVDYGGKMWPNVRDLLFPYPQEPPYDPTVLPTVESMYCSLPGCFRNPFVVRCVDLHDQIVRQLLLRNPEREMCFPEWQGVMEMVADPRKALRGGISKVNF